MGTTQVLAIVGIASTIVLGVWGICLMIKRKYPGQITFVRESSLGLFDSIVKNMPELAVQYEGVAVGQGLVLLKGSFLNTGSKDISNVMVEEEIAISLPDKFRWLTSKIVSASPKVEADVRISENSITFNTGLFRCKEYIRFEALAEVPTGDEQNRKDEDIGKRLIRAINLTHRIADTHKIKQKELPPTDYTLRRLKKRLIPLGTCVVLALVLIVVLLFTGIPAKLHFIIPTDDGKVVEVQVTPYGDGMLRLKGISDKTYKSSMSAEDFFSTIDIKPKVVPDKLFTLAFIVIILYIGLPFLFVCIGYREHRQTKKLRQLIDISD